MKAMKGWLEEMEISEGTRLMETYQVLVNLLFYLFYSSTIVKMFTLISNDFAEVFHSIRCVVLREGDGKGSCSDAREIGALLDGIVDGGDCAGDFSLEERFSLWVVYGEWFIEV